ncbi:2-amino-4-hydroxy-6-hydroxymethyldihydropteridine diphosphokinase [Luteibacter sp. UNCMF366Tsu5.1]|uniref:2-amino-4-hydroxy-6- hydroxymethyldihydropteridine diphosphokinase n=1 Tax=Luteibacter sp. UNCMF366Tsu5.1 TaxID=1502758 RepID=UPI0009089AFE|nr:2-amino-4-hydroxy-6-hydroxymethyldihydropteridine diphosphokinase [Luteibacter sp. UNCMF366Tsu5.1]SFW32574.1 2-amino-4-hydroxy-6-hydroxymethyldihydropteridinediphosphokinase [Luteibacter sp. UNCMF366Tsu5.1]
MSVRAFIGLGGNLGETRLILDAAIARLGEHSGIRITGRSRFYRTPPWGPVPQPDFVNAAIRIETDLAPHALLDVLLGTERAFGRVRDGERWGPRVLDLDLLSYGDVTLHDDRLHVPHPRMAERAFVLLPLADIDEGYVVAGQGSVSALLETLGTQGCEPLP